MQCAQLCSVELYNFGQDVCWSLQSSLFVNHIFVDNAMDICHCNSHVYAIKHITGAFLLAHRVCLIMCFFCRRYMMSIEVCV